MSKEEKKRELKAPQLKTMLNKAGKTPLEEPEIYAILMDEETVPEYYIPKFVIDRAGKTLEDFDKNDELSLFYRLIVEKVNGMKYENGEFKSTPKTKEIGLLSHLAKSTLWNMSKKAFKLDDDDVEGREANAKDQVDYIWNALEVDKNDLSEWEQKLVESQCFAQAIEAGGTSIGRELGNL